MAVLHHGVPGSGAEVYRVREDVAESTVANSQPLRSRFVVPPGPESDLGFFDPEILHEGPFPPGSPEGELLILAAGPVAEDRKILQRACPQHAESDAGAFDGEVVSAVADGRIPHPGPLNFNGFDPESPAGPILPRWKIEYFSRRFGFGERTQERFRIVLNTISGRAEVAERKRTCRTGQRRRNFFEFQQIDDVECGRVAGVLLKPYFCSRWNFADSGAGFVEEMERCASGEFLRGRIVDRIGFLSVKPCMTAGQRKITTMPAVDVETQCEIDPAATGGVGNRTANHDGVGFCRCDPFDVIPGPVQLDTAPSDTFRSERSGFPGWADLFRVGCSIFGLKRPPGEDAAGCGGRELKSGRRENDRKNQMDNSVHLKLFSFRLRMLSRSISTGSTRCSRKVGSPCP